MPGTQPRLVGGDLKQIDSETGEISFTPPSFGDFLGTSGLDLLGVAMIESIEDLPSTPTLRA